MTDVHISVVVHGDWAPATRCLDSIPLAAAGVDWTATVIENVPSGPRPALDDRVTVVVNASPRGFGANHNRVLIPVAERGSSRYVLVLNDDTELDPGCVRDLVRFLDERPGTGAATAQVRGPEGLPRPVRIAWPTIRSVWRHSLTGQTERADDAGWLQGCCLLLRVEALRSVGAFDERFHLFYEDVDLSRRLVAAGWDLGVNPSAGLVHFEHSTVGRPDLLASSLRHGSRSRYLYFEKHRGPLTATVMAAGVKALPRARPGSRRRPRLLVVSPIVPSDTASGGEKHLFRLMLELRERYEVHFAASLGRRLDDQSERLRALTEAGIRVHDDPTGPPAASALADTRFDVFLLNMWQAAEPLLSRIRRWQPWAPVSILVADLHWLRRERGAAFSGPAQPPTERDRELQVYCSADGLLFVSELERNAFLDETAFKGPTEVLPLIIDPIERTARRRDPVVLFVGSGWHDPNVDGADWFCTEVWPHVRQQVSDALLLLVGYKLDEVLPERVRSAAGVQVKGYVPDLGPLYDSARVAIAPLRYGAGLKVKVAEALVAGLTVVGTGVAVEGFEDLLGPALVRADTAEDLAAAVVGALVSDADAEGVDRQAIRSRFSAAEAKAAAHRLLRRMPPVQVGWADRLRWSLGRLLRLAFRAARRR